MVRRSQSYRELHPRLAGGKPPMPAEWWQEEGLTYLVFDLSDERIDAVPPMALFVTNNQMRQLVLARTIQLDSGVSTLFIDIDKDQS